MSLHIIVGGVGEFGEIKRCREAKIVISNWAAKEGTRLC